MHGIRILIRTHLEGMWAKTIDRGEVGHVRPCAPDFVRQERGYLILPIPVKCVAKFHC
jgi:hypothetical protein